MYVVHKRGQKGSNERKTVELTYENWFGSGNLTFADDLTGIKSNWE